jgi:hypothetical protein
VLHQTGKVTEPEVDDVDGLVSDETEHLVRCAFLHGTLLCIAPVAGGNLMQRGGPS